MKVLRIYDATAGLGRRTLEAGDRGVMICGAADFDAHRYRTESR